MQAIQPITQLPTKPTKDFTTFKVETLVDNSMTDFDLFIDVEKHFILYSGNGYRWTRDELTELLACGHQSFFIRNDDLRKAQMYHSMAALPKLAKEAAPRERIHSIAEVGAKFVQCLYEGELTEACVDKAKMLSTAMIECIAEDHTCIAALSGLADHDYYTYHHSVRVASYSAAIAVSMGLTDQAQLKMIALGSLFHDIGKRLVPLSIINKSGPLTDSEWKLMRSHPEMGFGQISDTVLSHVPREIILHHHEKRNGKGYPHGLDAASLLPEVQIATLADIFDALTSSRTYQTARTKFEALDFIKTKLLKEEIDPEAFKALVMCLAPKVA